MNPSPTSNPTQVSAVSGAKKAAWSDVFEWVMWGGLAVLAYQAILAGTDWALAWIVLGVIAILAKRWVRLHIVLAIEMPIFWAVVTFSATTMYVAGFEGGIDLVHDRRLTSAMWVAWSGTATFLAAFLIALRLSLGGSREERIAMTEKQGFAICCLGFFCNEVLLPVAPPSVWVIVITFGACAPLGLFILLQLYTQSGRVWVGTGRFLLWVIGVGWWVVDSVLGGIFGGTMVVLFLVFAPFIERSKTAVLVLLVIGMIFAPLLQDVKGDYRGKMVELEVSSRKNLKDVFITNFSKVILQGDTAAYQKGFEALAYRLWTFEIWWRVKNHMDTRRDYANGQTVWDALKISFIPRILWPTKPITGGSSNLAMVYGDMAIMGETSVGVGMISEFEINWGSTGVVLGMFAMGIIGGLILNFGWSDRVEPLGCIVSLLTFSGMVRTENNLSDVLGGIVRMVFLWLVLRAWILARSRRTAPYRPTNAQKVEVAESN